jgi:cytochrome c-type biogenesis protein CcmH/NrfF
MRKQLGARLNAGESIDSITDWYGKEHGAAALNVPPSRGYLKSVWLVPSALVILGGIGAAFVVRSWTKKSPAEARIASATKGDAPPAKDEYDAKLDDEIDASR